MHPHFPRMPYANRMTHHISTHANSFNYLIDVNTAPNRAFAVMHNAMMRLKWYMLSLPAWRAAVTRALGGDAALLRWERRAERSCEPIDAQLNNPLLSEGKTGAAKKDKSRCQYKPFKTDVDGLFRLARIPAYKPWFPPLEINEASPQIRRKTGKCVWRMTPIAVTPDELRGLVFRVPGMGKANVRDLATPKPSVSGRSRLKAGNMSGVEAKKEDRTPIPPIPITPD